MKKFFASHPTCKRKPWRVEHWTAAGSWLRWAESKAVWAHKAPEGVRVPSGGTEECNSSHIWARLWDLQSNICWVFSMCQSPYYTLIWGSCEGGTIITNLQGKKLRMRAIRSFVHSLRTNELDLEQAGAFNHYAVLNRRKGKVIRSVEGYNKKMTG